MATPNTSFYVEPRRFEVPLVYPDILTTEQARVVNAAGTFKHVAVAGVSAVAYGLQASPKLRDVVQDVPLLDRAGMAPNSYFLHSIAHHLEATTENPPQDLQRFIRHGLCVVAVATALSRFGRLPAVQKQAAYPQEAAVRRFDYATVPRQARDKMGALLGVGLDAIDPVQEVRVGYETAGNQSAGQNSTLYLGTQTDNGGVPLEMQGHFATLTVKEHDSAVIVQYTSGRNLAGGFVEVDVDPAANLADIDRYTRAIRHLSHIL